MVFKNICMFEFWTKIASALEGLNEWVLGWDWHLLNFCDMIQIWHNIDISLSVQYLNNTFNNTSCFPANLLISISVYLNNIKYIITLKFPIFFQFHGAVWQSLSVYSRTCKHVHHAIHDDAVMWYPRAAVIGRYWLPAKNAGRRENRTGGRRIFHETAQRGLRRGLDHKTGLVLSLGQT